MKRLLTGVLLGLLAVGPAGSAAAAPAVHDTYVEEWDATEHFAAGDGEPCVPWAGSFREVRSGEITLVTVSSGPRAGEVHVNGVIDGYAEFVPDDGSLPTYAGFYREKLAGVLVGLGSDEEPERVMQFRLRGVLDGTDGSTLTLVMSGKVTVTAKGEVVVDRFRFTCE